MPGWTSWTSWMHGLAKATLRQWTRSTLNSNIRCPASAWAVRPSRSLRSPCRPFPWARTARNADEVKHAPLICMLGTCASRTRTASTAMSTSRSSPFARFHHEVKTLESVKSLRPLFCTLPPSQSRRYWPRKLTAAGVRARRPLRESLDGCSDHGLFIGQVAQTVFEDVALGDPFA